MRISVIGTIHEDVGRATATALADILFRIRPDVIFLEMPPEAIADFFGGTRSNLESTAVNQYRAMHSVELVPVDLATPEPEFFAAMGALHIEMMTKSPDYCRLVSWEHQYAERHGFDYFNCEYHRWLQAELHEARIAILRHEPEGEHARFYERWLSVQSTRDEAMLASIREFSSGTALTSGVFLVGAAHIPAIVQSVRAESDFAAPRIEWEFVGDLTK